MTSGRRLTTDVVGRAPEASVIHDPDRWDAFVAAAGGGLAQTWGWGEAKTEAGWSPVRVGVSAAGETVGGAQILMRGVGRFGRIGYLDGGPLLVAGRAEVAPRLLEAIEAQCRHHRIRALTVDPPAGSPIDDAALAAAGYVPSRVKTSLGATVRVDLTRPEAEILAGMKSKTRYNIRKGQRAGIEVRRGGAADLAIFRGLLQRTADRQGFVAPDEAYLTALWDRLAPAGRLVMFLAEVDGEAVAAILVAADGDAAVYKRGAWDGRHGSAHPNEVLHWEAISWARDSGFSWYDFDGIEREVAEALLAGEETEGIQSVTRFKLGFGGIVVLLPRSSTLVPNRMLRLGYRLVLPRLLRLRAFRRVIRSLRSR